MYFDKVKLSVKSSNYESIAKFSSTLEDAHLLVVANNCNDYSFNDYANAGIFGAHTDRLVDRYEAFVGTKENHVLNKIAIFNREQIDLNANTIVSGNIIPSSNVVYDLGSDTQRWKDLYLSGQTISLGNTKIKSDSTTKSLTISDDTDSPLSIVAGEYNILAGDGNTLSLQIKDNSLFVNTTNPDGEVISELNISEMNTNTMIEGSNLFYTHERVANIINGSNVFTCNYIKNTSNKISNRITETSNLIEGRLTDTSNKIEGRLTVTSNLIEGRLTDTSNEISTRVTLLSTDQITEHQNAINRFIVNNEYDGDIRITGELRTSNLTVYGTTTTIETDNYTAEVLNIESLTDYTESALTVNKTGTTNVGTNIFESLYNDQIVAKISTEGIVYASNFSGYGSMIRYVRLADNFTDELAEGDNNLYFTHGRVATIIDGSNVFTCNYIKNTSNEISNRITDTSNKIEGRLTVTSNLIEGRLTETSNKIEGRLTVTSNLIEGRLTDTSNKIEGRLTVTSNLIEGRLTETSNKIEGRLTVTSNLIEGRLTETSNEIENRLTFTSNVISSRVTDLDNEISTYLQNLDLDQVHQGTSNKYIYNNVWDDNLYITGRLMVTDIEIADIDEIFASEGTGNIGNFYTYIDTIAKKSVETTIDDKMKNTGDITTSNINVIGNIIPTSNEQFDLGSIDKRWRDLYLSGNTINMGGSKISLDDETGGFSFKNKNNELSEVITSSVKIVDKVTNKTIRMKSKDNKISFVEETANGGEEEVVSMNDTWTSNSDNIQYGNMKIYNAIDTGPTETEIVLYENIFNRDYETDLLDLLKNTRDSDKITDVYTHNGNYATLTDSDFQDGLDLKYYTIQISSSGHQLYPDATKVSFEVEFVSSNLPENLLLSVVLSVPYEIQIEVRNNKLYFKQIIDISNDQGTSVSLFGTRGDLLDIPEQQGLDLIDGLNIMSLNMSYDTGEITLILNDQSFTISTIPSTLPPSMIALFGMIFYGPVENQPEPEILVKNTRIKNYTPIEISDPVNTNPLVALGNIKIFNDKIERVTDSGDIIPYTDQEILFDNSSIINFTGGDVISNEQTSGIYNTSLVPHKRNARDTTLFYKIFDVTIISESQNMIFSSVIYRNYKLDSGVISPTGLLYHVMFSYYSLSKITRVNKEGTNDGISFDGNELWFVDADTTENLHVSLKPNYTISIVSR